MYRFAIMGLGRIARKFASDLRLVEGATLTSVASRSQERADAFAEEFGARYAAGSYDELFEGPHLDAVYVATPHTGHYALVKQCLSHDLAVICEKPLGLNLAEVRELIDEARHRQVYLLEALWTRFLPTFREAKRRLDAGAIGEVTGMRADFGFKGIAKDAPRILDLRLGGGALLDIGIYPVFLAQTLLGASELVAATARFHEGGADVDETIVLRDDDGRHASLHATFLGRTPTEATVYGTEGVLQWHGPWYQPSSFTVTPDEGDAVTYRPPKSMGLGYHYEAQAMVEDLRAGRTESDLWSLDDSLRLHRTLTEIRGAFGLTYPDE